MIGFIKAIMPFALLIGIIALIRYVIIAIKDSANKRSLRKEIKSTIRKKLKSYLNSFGEYPSEERMDQIVDHFTYVSEHKTPEAGEEYFLSLIPEELPTIDVFIEKINRNITEIMKDSLTDDSFLENVTVKNGDMSDEDYFCLQMMEAKFYENAEPNPKYRRFNYDLAAILWILANIDELKEINETAATALEDHMNNLLIGKCYLKKWN